MISRLVKLILSLVLDCFTKQAAKKTYVPKPYKYDISDPSECQAKCQEREECMYFQHMQGKCYLKTREAKERAKSNNCCTFGPKYCNGIFYLTRHIEYIN